MVVAIAVLAGTTLRATRAEADANLRLAEAEAIAEFYDGILLTLRTIGAGPDVTVMQMADEMAQRVAADIAEHPLIRARVEYTLGSVYRDLGQYPQAAEFFRRCYDTRLAKLGLDATETRSAGVDLGTALSGADRGAEALALFEELTPIVERYDGRDDPRTITVKMELANVLDDNPQTSERSYEIYDEVYADLEASGRLATEQGCVLLANSGLLAIRLGKLDEAEARLKRAIEIGRGDVDFAFSRTAAALGHLGHLYVTQERFEEAEPLLTEAYEFDRTNMGEEFIGTNMNGDKLAVLMTRLGKYDRADELLTRGIANLTETLGPGHRYTLRLRQHQIELRVSEGRYDEALDLADAAIVHANTAQGEPNLWTPLFMDRKGHAYRFAGDDESADRMHAEGIEIRDRVDTQAPKSTPAPPPR
ncbi:MAG: tetratricopeptide repeat protein [Planctomycetota bacterium]